jgi:hypothetical protein
MRIITLATLFALAGTASAGESFTFKFSVNPIESGRARMSVDAPSPQSERQLVSVHGQAETSPWLKLLAPLDDDYRLVMDAKTHLPLQVVTVERGLRERRIAAQIDGRRAELDITAEKGGGRARRLLPGPVRDPLSQLFALRAAPLAEGDTLVHDILDGAALWRMRIAVHRGELLRLDMDRPPGQPDALPPSRTAIRLEGELTRIDDLGRPTGAPARHFTAWLSDDAQRVLLRAVTDSDLGKCTIELTGYTPGSS